MDDGTPDDDVRRVLTDTATWAVVGWSPRADRASHGVAEFLHRQGKRVLPVNPTCVGVETDLDAPVVASLDDIAEPVDVVDVFRRSSEAGAVADEAVAIGARAVWMQLGVVDEAAAERARAAGLTVVMDRCPKIEWPRLVR